MSGCNDSEPTPVDDALKRELPPRTYAKTS